MYHLWQRIKSAVNTLSSYFGSARGLNEIVEEKQRCSEDTKPGRLLITKEEFLQNLKLILSSPMSIFLMLGKGLCQNL